MAIHENAQPNTCLCCGATLEPFGKDRQCLPCLRIYFVARFCTDCGGPLTEINAMNWLCDRCGFTVAHDFDDLWLYAEPDSGILDGVTATEMENRAARLAQWREAGDLQSPSHGAVSE